MVIKVIISYNETKTKMVKIFVPFLLLAAILVGVQADFGDFLKGGFGKGVKGNENVKEVCRQQFGEFYGKLARLDGCTIKCERILGIARRTLKLPDNTVCGTSSICRDGACIDVLLVAEEKPTPSVIVVEEPSYVTYKLD